MNLLIVEDDLNKLKNLTLYLDTYSEEKGIKIDYTIKHSYQSGLECILSKTFDLLLLDMSLPNFDTDDENPLAKGGELILYEMDVMDITMKTVIFTQHDDFEGESLESIHSDYINKFSRFYTGYVFYNAIESNWKKELKIILDGVLND
jgi:CheY-like chemotaxis protein